MAEERIPLVDAQGNCIGSCPRSEAPKGVLYPIVFCYLTQEGKLFVQQRSSSKDIEPGVFGESAGGHVRYGESFDAAMARELGEELSVYREAGELHLLGRLVHNTNGWINLVSLFRTEYDPLRDTIFPDSAEIATVFWSSWRDVLAGVCRKPQLYLGMFARTYRHVYRDAFPAEVAKCAVVIGAIEFPRDVENVTLDASLVWDAGGTAVARSITPACGAARRKYHYVFIFDPKEVHGRGAWSVGVDITIGCLPTMHFCFAGGCKTPEIGQEYKMDKVRTDPDEWKYE